MTEPLCPADLLPRSIERMNAGQRAKELVKKRRGWTALVGARSPLARADLEWYASATAREKLVPLLLKRLEGTKRLAGGGNCLPKITPEFSWDDHINTLKLLYARLKTAVITYASGSAGTTGNNGDVKAALVTLMNILLITTSAVRSQCKSSNFNDIKTLCNHITAINKIFNYESPTEVKIGARQIPINQYIYNTLLPIHKTWKVFTVLRDHTFEKLNRLEYNNYNRSQDYAVSDSDPNSDPHFDPDSAVPRGGGNKHNHERRGAQFGGTTEEEYDAMLEHDLNIISSDHEECCQPGSDNTSSCINQAALVIALGQLGHLDGGKRRSTKAHKK